MPILFPDAMAALKQIMSGRTHRFWPLKGGLLDVDEEIRSRLVGHQQLTDAVLLDLAIRHEGRLATFDNRIVALPPPSAKYARSLVNLQP